MDVTSWPLPPAEECRENPFIAAITQVANQVLIPNAQLVDQGTVPPSHLTTLAEIGAFGLSGPTAFGGADVPATVMREFMEILAGACASTWLTAGQHFPAMRMIAESPNDALKKQILGKMCSGSVIAGAAVSHLRRPRRPALVAVPEKEGWRITGKTDWYSGWGLNDIMVVGAHTHDGRVVFLVMNAEEQDCLRASADLPLAAMGGTRTVSLRLDGAFVEEANVIEAVGMDAWRRPDALRLINASPAVFGIARAILAALRDRGVERGQPRVRETADRLVGQVEHIRSRAYHLVDHSRPDEEISEKIKLKNSALWLLNEIALTYLSVCGAAGMTRDHPAQRWAREALFFCTVQGSTPHVLRERADLPANLSIS
ncbi:acyl-CoA dehydrogenase family protein [Nonomuraea angiospora]|uniref:Alkylation response protein AidB-like acyl-CoA dehydrogenase n=1 Tax=Nonomuraea angiospora TaxID=46172 RepID=A0ABR9LNR7_9ACTN|nr:acyl-CoA dehydrogenase family protein [Nonomuraea angiospora]MBE1582288.1 alkylation response protein AidB-like acyl-CoA dehydrogenase [Nonomuraea angiospora]